MPEGTGFLLSIFGVIFMLNLEEKPPVVMNEMLAQAGYAYTPE
jgi:hypothetical protein